VVGEEEEEEEEISEEPAGYIFGLEGLGKHGRQ
jgi:hypothetical protein